MKWFERKKNTANPAAPVVQLRREETHPFSALDHYVPMRAGRVELYRSIREAVPIVDAAIWKLVRLCGGVGVKAADPAAQKGLERFWKTVDTGWGQRGVQAVGLRETLYIFGRRRGCGRGGERLFDEEFPFLYGRRVFLRGQETDAALVVHDHLAVFVLPEDDLRQGGRGKGEKHEEQEHNAFWHMKTSAGEMNERKWWISLS